MTSLNLSIKQLEISLAFAIVTRQALFYPFLGIEIAFSLLSSPYRVMHTCVTFRSLFEGFMACIMMMKQQR
jgi:hypothetical protein